MIGNRAWTGLAGQEWVQTSNLSPWREKTGSESNFCCCNPSSPDKLFGVRMGIELQALTELARLGREKSTL
jgi:hypothetical protein